MSVVNPYFMLGYQWSDARARLLRHALSNDEADAIAEFVDLLLDVVEAAERYEEAVETRNETNGSWTPVYDAYAKLCAALESAQGADHPSDGGGDG